MKNENRLILFIIPMANWPCEFDEKSKKIFHCSLFIVLCNSKMDGKKHWSRWLYFSSKLEPATLKNW